MSRPDRPRADNRKSLPSHLLKVQQRRSVSALVRRHGFVESTTRAMAFRSSRTRAGLSNRVWTREAPRTLREPSSGRHEAQETKLTAPCLLDRVKAASAPQSAIGAFVELFGIEGAI
jgi:hypothetical protein